MRSVDHIYKFFDGNVRLAWVTMNAELTSAVQTTIITPTIYREGYLGGLKRLFLYTHTQ